MRALFLVTTFVSTLALGSCGDGNSEGSDCDPKTFVSFCVDLDRNCTCETTNHKVHYRSCDAACQGGGYSGGRCNQSTGKCSCH